MDAPDFGEEGSGWVDKEGAWHFLDPPENRYLMEREEERQKEKENPVGKD